MLVGTWPSVNKCVGMGVPMCVLESVSVCLTVKKSVKKEQGRINILVY